MKSTSLSSSYADAGVDIDAGSEAVRRMKAHIGSTRVPGVLSSETGSFGGMFALNDTGLPMRDPVLVSSIDGIGTKLKIAFATGIHHTVGCDLVQHCVNDILVQGARPLFFLDYFGTGHLNPSVAADLVKGLAQGCRNTGCALIGGETAEMPDMYAADEYDVAGCIVGIVERRRIVDGSLVENGDIVIGLSSDGLHTNGYSLARRALLERGGRNVNDQVPELGVSLGEALLWQHRCYLKPVLKLLERDGLVHGMAHITGGGVIDNIPRILPNGLGVEIDTSAWTVPPLFKLIEQDGNIDSGEMYRVFNMGIGFVIVTAESRADEALKCLRESGETAMAIGRVVNGSDVVLV